MRAVLCTGPGDIRVDCVPDPPLPGPDWVKVKVGACGVCGSDLHKLLQAWPPPGYIQTEILGHEIAGTVVECGDQAHRLRPGDRVAVEPLIPCGNCPRCRSGHYQLCEALRSLGRNLPGGFADYVCVPERCLSPLPSGLTLVEGALTDVVAVAVHCINLTRPSNRGWKAAVIGDGPLGLITAQVARAFGAGTVVLIGKHRAPLDLAAAHGFAVTVPVSEAGNDLDNTFDVVVEAVGGSQADTLNQAIKLAAPGGAVGVLGVYEFGYVGQVALRQAFVKELRLIGCNSYCNSGGVREFEVALRLMAQRQVNVIPLVTHQLPLHRFPDVLDIARNKNATGAVKIVLEPQH